MTYQQAVDYIHSRPRFKNTDNHKAMRKLLDYLGNPQDNLKFVHIAGTNGKGSCAAMSANVLKTAGYKVGLNVSPFVVEFTERFQINGEYIPKDTLAAITEKIKFYQEKILAEDKLELLEFEIVTAIAFYYYNMEKCDIVVLEVGIGGLLDSTNVIKDSLVSCIMNISFDHTNILGNTLSEIAYQKAGIIKQGRPVICYPAQEASALETIKKVADGKNAPFILPDINDIKTTATGFMQSTFEYDGKKITQAFTGKHQSYNATVVIEAMKQLRQYGYNISDENIVNGIETTKFPARIEVISTNPLVILDGGHNIDGVTALLNVLKENSITGLTAVWASLSDKEPEKIIEMMTPYIDTLYTVPLFGSRALTPQQLADMARPHFKNVHTADSVESAIDMAMKDIGSGLLVFGSLYLASDARNHLINTTK
ncbi:MAG: bifunctional folylpolyglutamate synthase/dihydrofolate synthase [Oscillospiraceae bacterium]|nr:bifunctional folylpolyglutamate synthase/dihydrofolate synthase [Oscillospiraceae bacterium]